MARTVVTGGAGFVGSQLIRNLINLNHQVLVLDDLSVGKKQFVPESGNLEFLHGNITDRSVFNRVREFKPDNVIHLAAIHFIPYCNEHPVQTVETNLIGTRCLLNACKSIKPSTFIFTSSAAVYAISDNKTNEEDLAAPTDIYGMSKLLGEDLCKLFHKETGIRTVIGRLFNVFGPRETNPHVIPEIIDQLKNGKSEIELGNVEPKRDFIHVRDVADAYIALLQNFKGNLGTFNIGSGKEYSVRELIGICSSILGKEIKIISSKSRWRASDRMHLLANIDKITKETGWKPKVNIEEGFRELLS